MTEAEQADSNQTDELEAVLADALEQWQKKLTVQFAEQLMEQMRTLWVRAQAEQHLMNPSEKELLIAYRRGMQDTADAVKEILGKRKT